MAASNPLHRDASASRQPSTHSLHCFTARNAALPSHKVEGLIDPLRPWSGSRSCGGPPRPLPLPFEHALRADTRTLTAARARAVRVQPCHRILEATTMRRTAGIENNIGTRVERREKGSDRLPPSLYSVGYCILIAHDTLTQARGRAPRPTGTRQRASERRPQRAARLHAGRSCAPPPEARLMIDCMGRAPPRRAPPSDLAGAARGRPARPRDTAHDATHKAVCMALYYTTIIYYPALSWRGAPLFRHTVWNAEFGICFSVISLAPGTYGFTSKKKKDAALGCGKRTCACGPSQVTAGEASRHVVQSS